MSGSRSNMIKAKGLVTFGNELNIPEGSLKVADNVNIDEFAVITPRRGYSDFGNILPDNEDRLKQLMQYKGRIIRHFNSTMQFENSDGSFSDFEGSYTEIEAGIRVNYQESNSNLYFTTDSGVKKISASSADQFSTATGYVTDAGAIKAVDLSGKSIPNEGGFLPAQSKVAYRIVYGYEDKNKNTIIGSPSARFVLSNNSQDILLNEQSSLRVNGLTISNDDYILLYTTTSSYFLWFQTTGTDTAPNSAQTVGKVGIEIDVQGLNEEEVAVRIASGIINNAAGLSAEIDPGDDQNVLISTTETGDTSDIATGSTAVYSTQMSVAKIADGEITSGQAANSELEFTIPSNMPTDLGYFYRVYRSANVTAITGQTLIDIFPEDEMNLVLQQDIDFNTYSPGDTVTIEDITPETFRAAGIILYTNPISGQGILKANEQPPIAKDIELFNSFMFYANTKTRQRQSFTIVSVDGFTTGLTELIIGNEDVVSTYTFIGTSEQTDITVDTRTNTSSGGYIDINSANNEREYRVWMSTNSADVAPASDGRQLVRVALEQYDDTIAGSQLAIKTAIESLGDFSSTYSPESTEIIVDTRTNTTSGDYIDINSASDQNQYRIWFSTDIADTAPVDGGRQLVRASLENYGDSISGTQNALIAATSLLGDFYTSKNNDNIVITNSIGGLATDTTLSITTGIWAIDNIAQGTDDFSIVNSNNGDSTDSTFTGLGGIWDIPNIVSGTGEDAGNLDVLLSGLVSVGQAIDETSRSLVRVINKNPNSAVSAYYLSGEGDLPGNILLENRTVEDIAFYVATNDATIQEEFTPTLPLTEAITGLTISGDLTNIEAAGHNLNTGDEIFIESPSTSPAFAGKYAVTAIDENNFTIEQTIVVEDDPSSDAIFWVTTTYESTNDESSNRLYYSKLGQPESVPLLNHISIGPQDQAIERIIALRDYLIVLKADGIYLVSMAQSSGAVPSSRLLDDTANIIAPDSAATLNNQIFCLTTQGISTVTDSGVSIVSRSIEDQILRATLSGSNHRTLGVGIGYENDRAYALWLPTEKTDETATQAFRYNIFERSWTRWTNQATCAIINQSDDKMYIGDATRPYLLQERKNRDRTDHSDRDFGLTIGNEAIDDNVVRVSSVGELEVGDVIYQGQYLTISRYNQMLRKLDLDKSADLVTDYEAMFNAIPGVNMQSSFQSLINQLVIELGINPIAVSLDIEIQRDQWNSMVVDLNDVATPTMSKNYKEISTLVPYESIIKSINKDLNTVTLAFSIPLMQGDIRAYKAIKSIVQWQPQHYGDPSALKQIREGTIIFDQNNFYSARVEFASDASSSLVGAEFRGKGIAYFGYGTWGDSNAYWGGEGNDIPLRITIPRDKQRCRYLTTRYEHGNAREDWRILGITAVVRAISSRAYRS